MNNCFPNSDSGVVHSLGGWAPDPRPLSINTAQQKVRAKEKCIYLYKRVQVLFGQTKYKRQQHMITKQDRKRSEGRPRNLQTKGTMQLPEIRDDSGQYTFGHASIMYKRHSSSHTSIRTKGAKDISSYK